MSQKEIQGDIYLIKNTVNGKLYIGQSRSPNGGYMGRWRDHVYASTRNSNEICIIDRAIKKYGKDNFTIELLERKSFKDIDSCVDWMDEREVFYIAKHQSRSHGYNLTDGGKGARGRHISEELRAKLRSIKRNFSSRLGWKMSEHSKAKLSKSLKLFYSDDERKASALNKRRNTKSTRFYESKRKKGVLQYDKKGFFVKEYDSILSASISLGISSTGISAVCRNKRSRSVHGWIFKYKKDFPDGFQDKIQVDEYYGSKAKAVDQRSLDGVFLRSYPSAVSAGKAIGVKGKKISACIAGDYKTYKGYLWSFSNNTQQ